MMIHRYLSYFTTFYCLNQTDYQCRKYTSIQLFFKKFDYILKNSNIQEKSSSSNVSQYQDAVIKLLNDNKTKDNTEEDLRRLQAQIEDLTTSYDDQKNLYHMAPDLVKMMIRIDKPSAKDFLKKSNISSEDFSSIENFDQYTLEAIMVYALGYLFNGLNESPAVRLSTLVEQLDVLTRAHSIMLKERNVSIQKNTVDNNAMSYSVVRKRKGKAHQVYGLGILLAEFLLDRKVITLSNDLDFSKAYVSKSIKKKYYIPKSLYAICNFDMSLLPIKYNLPMVCEPLEWKVRTKKKSTDAEKVPMSLSDISGGYLSNPTGDFYNVYRYNLLSSRDLTHYYIVFEDDPKILCNTISLLQFQAFEINKDVLYFIQSHKDLLVESGLLMPSFLASLNVHNAMNLLRKFYLDYPFHDLKYNDLVKEFLVRIQRARYEAFIINLASAYEGYKFYLPAFLDFRGRIYRAGVLHFHERDLARSLIVFPQKSNYASAERVSIDEVDKVLFSAAAFHYKKFHTYDEAHQWYIDNIRKKLLDETLIQFALDAKDPYQFISKVICIEFISNIKKLQIPVTQDASASAYQIISTLLLDKELAQKTNLIPYYDENDNLRISDIYTIFLDELKVYLKTLIDAPLYDIISSRLTRNLMKSLFMPIVYGKTVYSMSEDIYKHFKTILGKVECKALAKIINRYFQEKYPDIINIMNLIQNVGWIRSALNKPVLFNVKVLTTIQDYMKSQPLNICIYDRTLKKKRQLTLRIPTLERDKKKTVAATFANYIHQKDAYIALMMVLDTFMYVMENFPNMNLYTVHDNYITTADYALKIPNAYSGVIADLDQLYYINYFLYQNLLEGVYISQEALSMPLSFEDLKKEIMLCIPKHLNKKDKRIWEDRVLTIYEGYKKYIYKISSIDIHEEYFKYYNYYYYLYLNYDMKRQSFKSEVMSCRTNQYNYSLHF